MAGSLLLGEINSFLYFCRLELRPYNARNGMENYMFDPARVSCVTDDDDIVTKVPHYTYSK